jgi:tetratricopeptide (TPR) repeat protein
LRATFLILFCLLAAVPAWPQAHPRAQAPGATHGQLDSSETLFTVMAAINAAGYDAEIDNPANSPVRKAVRDHLKSLNLPVVEELRRFVHAHKQTDPGADLSQYISYALVIDGPPDFGRHYANIVPPDVEDLEGLTPLIVRFYREANIAGLWKQVEPQYDEMIAGLSRPIARAVLQVNAYLRHDTAGYLGRNFQIYVDLMGAPNQVQMRSYVDDDYVVVTPASEPHIDQIRHAYLHYLLDLLPMKFSDAVKQKHALGDYALGSPILEQQFKSDFMLLTAECLIKAVESRLDKQPAEVEQALREGFVLTPAIAEQLPAYEAQEASMRLYFPTLVDGIDLKREEQRLDHIDFATTRSTLKIHEVTREVPVQLTGAAKTLDDAEKMYLARDLSHARDTFLQVLRETDVKSMHAKAYYGLARISLLEKDPQKAYGLFKSALEQDPDAETKSWSLLYLGRLADSQGWRDEAVEHYKAALAVPGAPDTVRQAAGQGIKSAFTKKQ